MTGTRNNGVTRYDPPKLYYRRGKPYDVIATLPEDLLAAAGLIAGGGLDLSALLGEYAGVVKWSGRRMAICRDEDGAMTVHRYSSLTRTLDGNGNRGRPDPRFAPSPNE